MVDTHIPRRTVLKAVAGAPLLGASAVLTTSCGTGEKSNSATRNTAVALPNYRVFEPVKPDLPGSLEGVSPGFLAYPETPVATVTETPGRGQALTVLGYTYDAPAPGPENNRLWLDLNRALGVDLKINYSRDADYAAKFSTTIAGGDIPDVVAVRTPQPNLPALLASTFQDLTEFLAGDAVEKYPALAALPTAGWRGSVFNGGIYGVPISRAPIGNVMFGRLDLIKGRGLSPEPANFGEFRALLKGLTDPKRNQWAMGDHLAALNFLKEMLHIPATWREEDGRFTHAVELEEYERALSDVSTLVKDGLFHPDAPTAVLNNNLRNSWFTNGTIFLNYSGAGGWFKYLSWGKDIPGYQIGGVIAPGYDGGERAHLPGPVYGGITAIKKTTSERVEEILRVLNWLSSPFGTSEYLLARYGIKDVDYTLSGADPILTKTGESESLIPIEYFAVPPAVLYEPNNEESTRAQHRYQQQVIPTVMSDPTVGLFSNINSTKGSALNKKLSDAQMNILTGRAQVSTWKDTVADWKREGGDEIRAEYEKEHARTR